MHPGRTLGCYAPTRMFPRSWKPASPPPASKRRRTFLEEADERAQQALPVEFESDLRQTVLRRLLADTPPPGAAFSLDSILSGVSYRAMLENLFGGSDPLEVPPVPVLCRSYEESLMRQPMAGEQACVLDQNCECMLIDRRAPFVGVELRLPGDPEGRQMCVLCSRMVTQKCFYDMCCLGRPLPGVIQRYGNIFGQPGEYSVECMLVCPPSFGLASMPLPAMSHQRNRYSVVVQGGVKSLVQHRVGHEDFPSPSSTGAA